MVVSNNGEGDYVESWRTAAAPRRAFSVLLYGPVYVYTERRCRDGCAEIFQIARELYGQLHTETHINTAFIYLYTHISVHMLALYWTRPGYSDTWYKAAAPDERRSFSTSYEKILLLSLSNNNYYYIYRQRLTCTIALTPSPLVVRYFRRFFFIHTLESRPFKK